MRLNLLAAFFLLISLELYGQAEESLDAKIARVRPGMNELQVRKLTGNPEVVESYKTLKRNTNDTCTYWRYENDVTIIFKRHVVLEIERDYNSLLQRIQEWADKHNKDSIILLYK